ncbi:hypothetical protein FI667_g5521, partial [Globisporangium splendens]
MREVWVDDDDSAEHAAVAPVGTPSAPSSPGGEEPETTTRKWTEEEETALLKYWRANVDKYVTKTKRFFYDEAARIPELKHKSTAQIKSKCFDTEKRYRDTNQMLRAAGIAVNGGEDPDASRRSVLKKFSLYYDVHPFLSARDKNVGNSSSAANTPAKNGASSQQIPPPAGAPTTFLSEVVKGRKRAVTPTFVTPTRVVSKRHREEIERFDKENEKIALANAQATKQAKLAAETSATQRSQSSSASINTSNNDNPETGSNGTLPQVQENSAMVQAATEKLQAEAKLATIRANAALLRERKALMDEGISVEEINALLPLIGASPSKPSPAASS